MGVDNITAERRKPAEQEFKQFMSTYRYYLSSLNIVWVDPQVVLAEFIGGCEVNFIRF